MNHLSNVQQVTDFNETQVALIKNLHFSNLTNDEFLLFLHVCKRRGLDPLLNQIYPVKRPTKQPNGTYVEKMSIQTGIDGYRLIAERTGKYAPGREPVFNFDKDGKIISCTSFVKKMTIDGTWHEVSGTAYFEEYCQKTKEGKLTKFWLNMPHSQIAKCSEAIAIRKAFPGELAGIYVKEEMQQSYVGEETVSVEVKEIKKVEEIVLNIPNDICKEHLDTYIEKTANFTKKNINEIKKTACENLDKFLEAFKKWEYKNYPEQLVSVA